FLPSTPWASRSPTTVPARWSPACSSAASTSCASASPRCCSVWARMPPSWPSRSPAADRLPCLGLPECADQPCLHRPTAGGPPRPSLHFSTALCPIGFRADPGRQDASPKGNPMTRRAVSSDQAPAALGPYSQAIVAGGFVFCSGTAGIDPATGAVGDGIEAQTEQALQNLAAVLEAAGASMA